MVVRRGKTVTLITGKLPLMRRRTLSGQHVQVLLDRALARDEARELAVVKAVVVGEVAAKDAARAAAKAATRSQVVTPGNGVPIILKLRVAPTGINVSFLILMFLPLMPSRRLNSPSAVDGM